MPLPRFVLLFGLVGLGTFAVPTRAEQMNLRAGSPLGNVDLNGLGITSLTLTPRRNVDVPGNGPLPLQNVRCKLLVDGVMQLRRTQPIRANLGDYRQNYNDRFQFNLTMLGPDPDDDDEVIELPFLECELPQRRRGENADQMTLAELQGYLSELFLVQAKAKVMQPFQPEEEEE
jgi:hypothetical protein